MTDDLGGDVDVTTRGSQEGSPTEVDTATPTVSVVTLTTGDERKLLRCSASVAAQDFHGAIEHVIVADGCEPNPSIPQPARTLARRCQRVIPVPRTGPASSGYGYLFPRLAKLLNIGITNSTGDWIALLDDDNEYEPSHISSLYSYATAWNLAAVHSSRQIVWADGSPYLEPVFPWSPDLETGRSVYAEMVKRGLMRPGDNTFHDHAGTIGSLDFVSSTIIGANDQVVVIDTNVYFLRADLAREVPIPERYSDSEIAEATAPDDKLAVALLRRGVLFGSTRAPTVRYYLGGMSNRTNIGSRESAWN